MSGLVKAKRYDWKDSNLAMFGSALDKSVKKESALKEAAWKGVGEKVGLKIWRIVNFKVTEWPEKDYGSFFSGDSYIILNTYKLKGREELAYDVHFWIGSKSTQDEYCVAAYKTVELDAYLDDAAIQHRDAEGNESDLFLSYFENGLTIMEGGAEMGFNNVKPEEYKARLLHFSGLKKHIVVKEVPLCPQRLKSDDVFILDLGRTLYQWNGTGSNKDERFKAMQYLQNLKAERGAATSKTLEEEHIDKSHEFYTSLTGEDEDLPEDQTDSAAVKTLLRVSDAAGHFKSTVVKTGHIAASDLDSKDVFILDNGSTCFVWVGNGASAQEKRNGLGYAHSHLMKTPHPLIPILRHQRGQASKCFNAALAA
uniref:Gelsolin-like protein 2 n=2 Tax=Lumbricus terrestris TaxID=6398 RepID=GELS2_LUMTE|nr:RecName: Full=Gelsolin-like protein 2; AltName: Full=Actin-modulator; Short=EWAM-P2 [Lumbricus terrestris]ATE46281.1 actin-modulating protein EWAM-P2 [Lumbricus terrestris]CAD43405.1 gelsolin-like protein [Lumbricus terrestris]